MRRGELYRVRRPVDDPKPARVFLIVSRQALIDSNFSTVVCAPVFSVRGGLTTQVAVGPAEGLKHDSAVLCDGLMSIEKTRLTDFVGELSSAKLRELDHALAAALAIESAPSDPA